jgi:hypothetical protein
MLGRWARLMCADGYPRKIRVHTVEPDGDGGWHVSGLDSAGYTHRAYLRNDLTQEGMS